MFFPKKELFLMIADNITEEDSCKYDRVHKIVYMVGNDIRKKFNEDIGYKFGEFMSHAGPYDKELQDDIDVWCTIGLVYSRFDNRLTNLGKSFLNSTGINRLEKSFGDKQGIDWLKKIISEYSLMKDEELIEKSVFLWSQEYPDKKDKIKEFFPLLSEKNT